MMRMILPLKMKEKRGFYIWPIFSHVQPKFSKADGGISQSEIAMTENLMNRLGLDEKTKEFAKNVFRKAKISKRSIDEDFKEIGKLVGYEPTVGQSFLGGLFEIARSNGEKMNEMQVRLLLRGEERLKLPPGTVISWVQVVMLRHSMTLPRIAYHWRKLMKCCPFRETVQRVSSRKRIV